MPNWCNNTLILRHKDEEMISQAINAWKRNQLCSWCVPEPDYGSTPVYAVNLHGIFEKAEPNDAWYYWRRENWGTKWDVGYDKCRPLFFNSSTAVLNFKSAWTPPIPVFKKLQDMGFEVFAHYSGELGEFRGIFDDSGDHRVEIPIDTPFPEDEVEEMFITGILI